MNATPLISCIMPTFNRRAFVPRAIRCFLDQDYPETELLILDDGADAVVDLIPEDPRIHYARDLERRSHGAKCNALCATARGRFIAHWDDDDWYPPDRLTRQAQVLSDPELGVEVCGSSRAYYVDAARGRAWEYGYAGRRRPYVLGNTLCYTRAQWQRNPFQDLWCGSDTQFLSSPTLGRVHDFAEYGFVVASVHENNVSFKRVDTEGWRAIPMDVVRRVCRRDETLSP